MAIVTSNVLVGAATLYTAPVGTAAPLDSLADGAPWLTPWTHVGATEEGVSLAVGTDTVDIRIEEKLSPVLRIFSGSNIRITCGLSEDTIETMKLAYGGGTIATQAAAVGVPGKKTLALSDSLTTITAGFEGVNALGFWRRIVIPKVVAMADITTVYRRSANNRSYGVELFSLSERSEILISEKTAVAL